MIGQTLGSYRIIEQVGAGGMATVYKAYDPGTDRYVALKVLPEHFFKDPTFRQRFEREAKAIARLEHIHILPIFAYGEDAGVAYLVMRFIQAGTLADRIGQGPLPFEEISRVLDQIASALDYAHRHGIVHRDVKPSNVLIDADGNAFLTDFGIARMVEGSSELTGSGLIGTPYYMSPEQCQGDKNLTPASDQYSLGIVLYEMLSGRKPYQAETPVAVILMHLNDPLPSPRNLCPGLTEDMEKVLFKALAKQPDLRYPNCCAMASAFAEAVASRPAAVPMPVEPPARPVNHQQTAHILDEDADQLTVPLSRPAPARARRGLPGWGIGLIGVLVLGVLIGGLALSGMFNRPQIAATPPPTSPPATATSALVAVPPVPKGTRILDPCTPTGVCINVVGSPPAHNPIETGMAIANLAWGPDGQVLISGLKPGASPEHDIGIYIINVDGSELRHLPIPDNNVGAVWSPDGALIAMHSSGTLAVVNPDATGYRSLWDENKRCAILPQWSPDSQRIVFTADWCDASQHDANVRRVMIARLDRKVSTLIRMPENATCHDATVAFSPDGRQVAYMDERCRPTLISADGPGSPQLMAEFPFGWTGSHRPQWGK